MLPVTSAQCVARGLHTMRPGHLSVRVGDGSRCSEEIVKNLKLRLWMRLLLLLLLLSLLLLLLSVSLYYSISIIILQYQYHYNYYSISIIIIITVSVCLLVGCLTSQQHVSVSQGWICSDNFTCCHTEIEVADQTFYLTQSQYTDTGPTSPNADPITPGAWQGSHWSANF